MGSDTKGMYRHLVFATMPVVMFGGMCRYDDASRLLWRNFRFLEERSGYEIPIDKRKNANFRQINKVLVISSSLAAVCPWRLL